MQSNNERASLAAKFDRHVEEEGNVLEEYRKLSDELGAGSIGFFVDLILTEEEQHHFLLKPITQWLRNPPVDLAATSEKRVDLGELLEHTQRLRQHEQETIAAYRDLETQLSGPDRALIVSLLDAMILDSEKHGNLLLAVENMIQASEDTPQHQ
jgi:hypothetical protein